MLNQNTNTEKNDNFNQRLRVFTLSPEILGKFDKRLTPDEKFILKVLLLQQRDDAANKLRAAGGEVTEDFYAKMDEIVVDAYLKTGDWDRVVQLYLQRKIQDERARAGIASSRQTSFFQVIDSQETATSDSSAGISGHEENQSDIQLESSFEDSKSEGVQSRPIL